MKDSEYGGADTEKTDGVQPPPHEPTQVEKLRGMYRVDPEEKLD